MDLDPGLLLLLLWGVLSIFGGMAKKRQQGQQQQQRRRQQQAAQPGTRERTRRQPETFDDLLTEMREQLEEAKRAEARQRAEADRPGLPRPEAVERPREPLPWAEDVEERESLEEEPVIVSLETPVTIEEREMVDSDLEAQRLIASRLQAAEQRNRAWRLEDHKKFDARIRAAAPEKKLPAGRAAALRNAVVWREILGKPVSIRER